MATMTVLNSVGGTETVEKPLAPARAAAAASRPVVLSNEDFAVLDGLETLITATNAAITAATIPIVNHDAADSGGPLKVGGRARSSEIAAITNDDRADFITDLTGKQIILPYANPENFVSGVITSAMTATTSTAVTGMGAPGGSLRNYITQLTVSNSHATVGTDVELQDGSGGATFYIVPAAAVYGGAAITFPAPLKQPTVNTALYAKNSVTGASVRLSVSGYKGL